MNHQKSSAHLKHAESHLRSGNTAEAIKCFQLAIETDSSNAKAHFGLGNVYASLDDADMASESFGAVIALYPNLAAAHFNKANMDRKRGETNLAIQGYREAAKLDPQAGYFNNLGTLLAMNGQLDAAAESFQQAINLDPNFFSSHLNLAKAYYGREHWPEAVEACRCALELDPQSAPVFRLLARCWKKMDDLANAISCYEQAVGVTPDNAELRIELAVFLRSTARLSEAIDHYRAALKLDPNNAKGHSNFAEVLRAAGLCEEAIVHQRRALELDPSLSETHSNLLLTMMYLPQFSPQELLQEARRWAAQHTRNLRPLVQNANATERERIRIGYVSANFHNHPVGIFLEPVLRYHDHEQFEIYVYANQTVEDDRTLRIRKLADHFHIVVNDSDEELAARIRNDEINIVVDLSGHTAGNRLLALARKPAPLQVSWAAYSASTGLPAFDFILADRWIIPDSEEQFYAERIERLPNHYVCFDIPSEKVVPIESAESRRTFTFGCFNNRAKICSAVVETWSTILSQQPQAKLFLKTASLGDVMVRENLLAKFAERGITRDRIRLEGHSPRPEFLAAYQQVDLCLDPFPFNGGVTTIESLWMGVPVLTVRGDRFVANASQTFLRSVRLEDLVVESLDEYINTACDLASTPSRLKKLGSGLRDRLLASPLCDHQQFTQDLEDAFRRMWARFVAARR